MIPRTLHWIWLSDEPLGRTQKRCLAMWRRHAPGFAIRRWTLADFPREELPPWVHMALASGKWAFACDYLRLWVLAHEGGWYLDSDVLLLKSLVPFENHAFVTAVEYYPGKDYPPALQAAAMGSVAGHPFVTEVMAWYEKTAFVLPDGSYNTSRLAPHILADAALCRGFAWRDERQELRDDMLLLPSFVFAPGAAESTGESCLIHLCNGSWRDLPAETLASIDRANAWTVWKRTTRLGGLATRVRALQRHLFPGRTRVLAVDIAYMEVTGGAVIDARNLRWLKACFGEDGVRRLALPWHVFDPLALRPGVLPKVRALVRRVLCILVWRWELLVRRPEFVFFGNSAIRVPSFAFLRKFRTLVFYHNIEQDYYRLNEPRMASFVAETERRLTQGAAARLCLTARDADRLKALYGKGADLLMPTTLADVGEGNDGPAPDGDLLFVGSDFPGNSEGLFWFVENCLERIGRRLLVVGTGMDRYRGKYAALEDRGLLEFRGYVPDLGALYRGAKAVVLPILHGCGMKTKTAEALMHDKVIYGTDEAFAGYEGIDEIAVRCNGAEAFVAALRTAPPVWTKRPRDYFLARCGEKAGEGRFRAWMKDFAAEDRGKGALA